MPQCILYAMLDSRIYMYMILAIQRDSAGSGIAS